MRLSPTTNGRGLDAAPLATLVPFTVTVDRELWTVGVTVVLVTDAATVREYEVTEASNVGASAPADTVSADSLASESLAGWELEWQPVMRPRPTAKEAKRARHFRGNRYMRLPHRKEIRKKRDRRPARRQEISRKGRKAGEAK
jgi:hypothetical protein